MKGLSGWEQICHENPLNKLQNGGETVMLGPRRAPSVQLEKGNRDKKNWGEGGSERPPIDSNSEKNGTTIDTLS